MQSTGGGEYVARVVEAQPSALFVVELENGHRVQALIAATERIAVGRLVPGDKVWVALSPYDPGRGRILRRSR
jgi:translation initiation factor IF-1